MIFKVDMHIEWILLHVQLTCWLSDQNANIRIATTPQNQRNMCLNAARKFHTTSTKVLQTSHNQTWAGVSAIACSKDVGRLKYALATRRWDPGAVCARTFATHSSSCTSSPTQNLKIWQRSHRFSMGCTIVAEHNMKRGIDLLRRMPSCARSTLSRFESRPWTGLVWKHV